MDDIEVKRMYSADDRRAMAKAGHALPDGSFPIKDEEDLKNAIQAFGRASDPKAAKLHILKRATDLGAEDLIPESWGQEMTTQKSADDVVLEDPAVLARLAEEVPDDLPEEEEEDDEDMPKNDEEKGMYYDDEDDMEGKAVVRVNTDGEAMKCAKGLTEGCGFKAGAKVCGKCGAMAVETKSDEYAEDDATEVFRLSVEDPEERAILRRYHLEDMGTKSADIDAGAFTCMMEQKVFGSGTAPCADCTGGCLGTKGLPDLAEMEAVAGALFGRVLDSGYSDTADRFLVAVQRKDGLFEAHFDGQGEFQALIRLPEDWVADEPVITAAEAVDHALSTIEGKALAIDASVLEGHEVYAVEIEGTDGKSYDVFVDPTDGSVLAYDAYELSADDVEVAPAGEVNIKSVEDPEFAAALMEFQILEAEQDLPSAE
jgi:uncharacterized membrane protein YkoI